MVKKKVVRMWMIYDVLFLDKERAQELEDGKSVVREVFVGLDDDVEIGVDGEGSDFFGSWIFSKEHWAQDEVSEYNKC